MMLGILEANVVSARARRAGHQQMMFPGRRHLQRPLDMILADHLRSCHPIR